MSEHLVQLTYEAKSDVDEIGDYVELELLEPQIARKLVATLKEAVYYSITCQSGIRSWKGTIPEVKA